MPSWSTFFTKAHFVTSSPRQLLELIQCSVKAMKIPLKGTKWSAYMFGDRVVIFAKWSKDDETEAN